VLRRLYVEERRTLAQVAAALGASDRRVRAAIVAAGIPLRPARRRADRPALPTLTAEQLTDLHVAQRLTTEEIAARYGGSDTWVRTALQSHGISRRRGGARPVPSLDLDTATLTDLYVTRRLDDPVIAARFGVPTWRVTVRRRELGVTRPAVPPPHPRAAARTARCGTAAALSRRAATHRGHRRPVRHRSDDGPAVAARRQRRGPAPHRPGTPPHPRHH
jgi:hypothetical protein